MMGEDAGADDVELHFRDWSARFPEYYEPESRQAAEFLLSRQMVLTARKWTSFIDEAIKRQTGHSRARWQTLFTLAFLGRPTPTLELSHKVGVRWPTLIRTLKELEELGLVERARSDTDQRARFTSITDAGLEVVDEVQRVLDPTRHKVLEAMSTEDLVHAEATMRQFYALLCAAEKTPA